MSIHRQRVRRAVASAVLALVAKLGSTACGDADSAGPDEGTTLEDLNEEGAEDRGDLDPLDDDASEEDIASAPNEDDSTAFFDDREGFLGEPVTVSAEIVEVLSPRAFVIGRGDQATLVTRPDAEGVTLLPGYVAQVTGHVGTFVLTDVESQLDQDLDDEVFDLFQDGPYIAAVDVNLLNQD